VLYIHTLSIVVIACYVVHIAATVVIEEQFLVQTQSPQHLAGWRYRGGRRGRGRWSVSERGCNGFVAVLVRLVGLRLRGIARIFIVIGSRSDLKLFV